MDELLSTSEAASELGITRQGIDYLIKTKQLKAQRVGRFLVIERAEVERVKLTERKPGRPRKKQP